MGLWAFMFVVALLLPILLLCMGAAFKKGGPKEINSVVGYRTHRSMQSVEAWRFAHQYSGALFKRSAWSLCPFLRQPCWRCCSLKTGLKTAWSASLPLCCSCCR